MVKTKTKSLMGAMLSLTMVLACFNGTRVSASDEGYTQISNDYIAARIYPTGYVGSAATGKITGKAYRLTYNYDRGQDTGFTSVRLDNKDILLANGNYTVGAPTNVSASENVTTYKIGNVQIKQDVQIVNNSGTGRADTIKYTYVLENKDTAAHSVGVRMLFDTMLGEQDGAPFRIPGIGSITTEKSFTGNQIPQYWQVFESLQSPDIMAQGTLKGGDATTPDKFALCDWGDSSSTLWDYSTTEGKSVQGDSSVLIWWNPVNLAAGQTKQFSTYYGLGTISGSSDISVTGPAQLNISNNKWDPNPFVVTAYINNKTGNTLTNVPVDIILPDGLVLQQGENAQKVIPSIANNADGQVSWNVLAQRAGTFEYTVRSNGKEAKRSIVVPELPIQYISHPTSTITSQPQANAQGFNNTDVKVSITAVNNVTTAEGAAENTQNKPGIKEIHYSINGTAKVVNGDKAEINLTEEGIYKIKYWSVSEDSVVEQAKEYVVKVDKGNPVIKINNEAGDYSANEDFKVNVEISDTISGIKSSTITFDGQPVTQGQVVDLANKLGTHVLKVTAEDNASHSAEKTLEIRVVAGVISVTLDKHQLLLEKGKTGVLKATVLPESAPNKEVTWSSSNPNIVSVENGNLKAKAVGEAIITVTTKDGGYKDTCRVVVEDNSEAMPVTGTNIDYLIPLGIAIMAAAVLIFRRSKPQGDQK